MVFFEVITFLAFLLLLGVLLFFLSRQVEVSVVSGFLTAMSVFHLVFVMIFLIVPIGGLLIDLNEPECEWLVNTTTVSVNETVYSYFNSCEDRVIPAQYEVMYVLYLYWLLFLGIIIFGSFIAYLTWLIRRWF